LSSAVTADEPLRARVDRLIEDGFADSVKQVAPLASDAEFLRRVTLDLTGNVPSVAEARAFRADTAADKRARLVDRLLTSPGYARRFRDVFDVMLMERRPDKHVARSAWQDYLYTSFAQNKPYDQMVREILLADGTDPKTRPMSKFYLDRECEPNLVTRDIARLLLGMNLTCAQCHDHPVVEAYKQDFYYGIFAFFNRSYLFNDRKNRQVVFAEKAEGEVSFQSVFDPAKVTKTSGMRLPGGTAIKEPKADKGKEYETVAKDARPVPKFSRRAQLAPKLTGADNVQFRRNIANRIWALLMGRGLVHPLDFDHAANPPSHPELLTLLGDELATHHFDLRWLIRELTLTKTYQRSSELPAGAPEPPADRFAVMALKPLTPEQLAWSMMQASGLADSERKALGAKAQDKAIEGRLSGNVPAFVAMFATGPGQDEIQTFQVTLDQALFLKNGTAVRQLLSPRDGNLTDRLSKLAEIGQLTDELYESVLTRLPTDDERRETAEAIKARGAERPVVMQDLVWALLTSAEFRFNH
jgi:hypothetical protein